MGKIGMPGGGGGADTSVVTAGTNDVLEGKVIVDAEGNPLTGTMPHLSNKTTIDHSSSNSTPVVLGDAVYVSTNSDGVDRVQIRYQGEAGYIIPNTLFGVPQSDVAAAGGLTADKMINGQSAFGINGTIPNYSSGQQAVSSGKNDNGVYYYINYGHYRPDSSGKSWVYRPLSDFGAVPANKVVSGQTFTSTAGLKVTGTMAVTSAINFKATALSGSSIRISWTNPSKGPWAGVFIQMSTSGSPGTSGGTRVYTGAGTNTTASGSNYVDITGLSLNTTYYFTCTSYCDPLAWGSSYNVSATTKGYVLYDRGTNYAGLSITNSSNNEFGTNFIAMYTGSETNLKLPSINYANYSKMGIILSVANLNAGSDYPQIAFYSGSTLKHLIMNTGQIQVTQDDIEWTFSFDISSITDTASYNLRVRLNALNGSYVKKYIKVYKIWLE